MKRKKTFPFTIIPFNLSLSLALFLSIFIVRTMQECSILVVDTHARMIQTSNMQVRHVADHSSVVKGMSAFFQ